MKIEKWSKSKLEMNFIDFGRVNEEQRIYIW